jgi:tape measure domain-containing protein
MASSRAIEAAKAFVRIYADDTQLRKTLGGIKGQINKTNEAFSGSTVVLAGLGAGAAGLVATAASAERTAVAFEVMLGSGEAAKKMLDEIYALGKESPFGAAEFMQSGQTLLNFGASADSVLPTMRMLGDIAAGDSEKLQRMTVVYGQMSAAGRLMGQDLLQMINAGVNPLQEISKRTGESMLQLKKRMEAGGISSGEVAQAFQDATSEGGRFFGMTQRISKTTIGVWMTLKDEIMMLAKDMGGVLLPAVNMVLRGVRGLVSLFSGWGKGIVYAGVAMAAFLMTIKALTLAQIAYTKAAVVAQAFTGPKGWAVLAAGAAAAAIAVAAVDLSTANLAADAQAAHPPLNTMAKDVAKIAEGAPIAASGLKLLDTATADAQATIEKMKSPVDKARAAVDEFAAALAASGKYGMVLDGKPLVEAFRQQESGYTDSLQKIQDEIRVLSGVATEAGIELQHMLDVGVDPAKVEQLRALTEKRDELLRKKENDDYWKQRGEELQAAADEVKASLRTVEESYALEKQRLGELVGAGKITQGEANASLAQNPEFKTMGAETLAAEKQRLADMVSAGKMTQEQADASLRKNAAFRKIDPQGIADNMRASTGPAQDLRSVAGASQITGLLNGQRSIQEQQVSLTRAMREELKRLRIAAERKDEVVKI